MTIEKIKIPDLGDALDVEVIEICVKPGDMVTKDDSIIVCLLYTSPSPRDATLSRMPSSA